MALLGSVALIASGAILWVLRADRVRTIVALGAIAVAPALLGHVFLNRYDPWPAALVSVALLLVLVRRLRSAFALLAIAVTAKIYAAAALPVAAVRVARVDGRPGLRRALVAFVVAGAIVTLPFAVVGFGGLGDSFYVQSTRPLQIESLGASFLLVGDQLGLYDARFFAGKGNSIDLHGMLPDAVAVLTSLLLLATVALVVWLYVRGRESTEAFLVAFVASITAYVVFFKVFSPQYMTWLVPLVPLVAGTRGRLAVVAFLAALLATQVEIYGFEAIHPIAGSSFLAGRPDPWAPWLLLGRNLLLLGVLALLIGELRALSLPRAAPARAAPAAAPGSYFDPTAAR
jgi:hypothetical protein